MRIKSSIKGIMAAVFAVVLTFNVSAQEKDIVELAAGSDDLSTLVTAVKAADLVETLQMEGPYTVFAPTNEAFEALPEGTLEMLLKSENKDKLVSVLTYHVVPGKVMSGDIKDGMKAKTAQGSSATINVKYGNVMVDGAKVVAADVTASNGVVHIINKVILPPSIEKALSSADTQKEKKEKKGDG